VVNEGRPDPEERPVQKARWDPVGNVGIEERKENEGSKGFKVYPVTRDSRASRGKRETKGIEVIRGTRGKWVFKEKKEILDRRERWVPWG